MESVEVGERKSRTVTYASVGIGFEVIGAQGLPPTIRYRLVVKGQFRVVAFACAAEFNLKVGLCRRSPPSLIGMSAESLVLP